MTTTTEHHPVTFVVKESGWLEKLFGADKQTYYAADMKIEKDFNQ